MRAGVGRARSVPVPGPPALTRPVRPETREAANVVTAPELGPLLLSCFRPLVNRDGSSCRPLLRLVKGKLVRPVTCHLMTVTCPAGSCRFRGDAIAAERGVRPHGPTSGRAGTWWPPWVWPTHVSHHHGVCDDESSPTSFFKPRMTRCRLCRHARSGHCSSAPRGPARRPAPAPRRWDARRLYRTEKGTGTGAGLATCPRAGANAGDQAPGRRH